MPSRREAALTDLATRLGYIQVSKGYRSDAGLHLFFGEAPTFGPDDPPAAIAVFVGDSEDTTAGSLITSRVPLSIQGIVPADIEAPLVALEALITDIKVAVEIEGNDPGNLSARADIDRYLGTLGEAPNLQPATLPKGLERVGTRQLPRSEGSVSVGASVDYVMVFQEAWGRP